jgi:hypothetical protein
MKEYVCTKRIGGIYPWVTHGDGVGDARVVIHM